MIAYRHMEEGTSRLAYTRDAGGRRLPVQGSVWLFLGAVDLDPQGAPDPRMPARQIKAELLRKGYFLWPDDAQPDVAE